MCSSSTPLQHGATAPGRLLASNRSVSTWRLDIAKKRLSGFAAGEQHQYPLITRRSLLRASGTGAQGLRPRWAADDARNIFLQLTKKWNDDVDSTASEIMATFSQDHRLSWAARRAVRRSVW